MLPGKDQLNICFAHSAYRMAERFAARGTGIAHFQVRTPEEFAARLSEADVVVVSMLWSNELLAAAKRLKFIQSISSAMDRYDAEIRARGVRLASAAGVNAHAVAEHAMALILALKRHIHTGRDNQSAKVWRGMISDIGAREDIVLVEIVERGIIAVGEKADGDPPRQGRLGICFGRSGTLLRRPRKQRCLDERARGKAREQKDHRSAAALQHARALSLVVAPCTLAARDAAGARGDRPPS